MTPRGPMTHTSVSDAIAKAIDEINRLCAGRGRMTRDGLVGRDWTMCIPHQDDDSDHVFAELVIACKRLQAENRDLLESQLAARRDADALRGIADGALKLAEEVASAHCDRRDAECNACEKPGEACAFCEETKTLRAALATTPEER